jgi:hypothetical protein
MPGSFRVSIALGAVIAATLLLVPDAYAQVGVPSAATSTIPTCIVASPDGAFISTVVVRDAAGTPVSGSKVVIDFSSCNLFAVCSFPCSGCTAYPQAHTVQKAADANGSARFDLRVGNVCPNERVSVYADAILLGTAAFSSLDQNGDLSVTGADMVRVQAAMITGDLSADFDCSGTVTIADLNIMQAHMGVTCNGVVPALRRTWGTLKDAYR